MADPATGPPTRSLATDRGIRLDGNRSYVIPPQHIGATSMEQLRTDIASIEVKITSELEKRIDAIHVEHCNPCP